MSMSLSWMREQARGQVKRNIQKHGFHIYVIGKASYPRFGYTIGLTRSLGAELVLPGAAWFSGRDVGLIIHVIRNRLVEDRRFDAPIAVEGFGSFTLRTAHRSWTRKLLLGALDYYACRDVAAYQIVPDEDHWTIDVPDLSVPLDAGRSPAWQWLREPWRHPVPASAYAITDLAALRGSRITQVARWEDDSWEIFATPGSQVPDEQLRVVPLGCFLASDPSMAPILDLAVGEAIWREEGGDWHTASTVEVPSETPLS
jgi:hypothetical protein